MNEEVELSTPLISKAPLRACPDLLSLPRELLREICEHSCTKWVSSYSAKSQFHRMPIPISHRPSSPFTHPQISQATLNSFQRTCRIFRDTALATPQVWAHLLTDMPLSVLERLLERSGKVGLSLSIFCDPFERCKCRELTLLLRHVQRWKWLTCTLLLNIPEERGEYTVDEMECCVRVLWRLNLPSLISIDLNIVIEPNVKLTSPPVRWTTPSLKSVTAWSSFGLSFLSYTNLAGLTQLIINPGYRSDTYFNPEHIFVFLRRPEVFDSLESLWLNFDDCDGFDRSQPEEYVSPPIRLPRLQYLFVDCSSTYTNVCEYKFLQSLDTPNASVIALRLRSVPLQEVQEEDTYSWDWLKQIHTAFSTRDSSSLLVCVAFTRTKKVINETELKRKVLDCFPSAKSKNDGKFDGIAARSTKNLEIRIVFDDETRLWRRVGSEER